MSLVKFTIQGEVRHVDVNTRKDKPSALLYLRYGPERAEVEGTNFVNAVVIRVGSSLYERVEALLKVGRNLTVSGRIQGVMDGQNRSLHLVAEQIEEDAFAADGALVNQVTMKGVISDVALKGRDKVTALLLVKYGQSDDAYFVPEVYARVPNYRYDDVKSHLRAGTTVLIQGRLQGISKQAMYGDGYTYLSEVIAERLTFGRAPE